MRYNEETVQRLSEHLNEMAESNTFGVHVVPVRITRGVWDFSVTDNVGGNWTKEGTRFGYQAIINWIRMGF